MELIEKTSEKNLYLILNNFNYELTKIYENEENVELHNMYKEISDRINENILVYENEYYGKETNSISLTGMFQKEDIENLNSSDNNLIYDEIRKQTDSLLNTDSKVSNSYNDLSMRLRNLDQDGIANFNKDIFINTLYFNVFENDKVEIKELKPLI